MCSHNLTHTHKFTHRHARQTINTCTAAHSQTHVHTSLRLFCACQSPFPPHLGSLCFSTLSSANPPTSASISRLYEAGRQSASLQEAFGDRSSRQRFLVYFHELLTGHPAAADAVSERVRRGLLRIETASKHYCGVEPLSGRPRNEGASASAGFLKRCFCVCMCVKALFSRQKKRWFRAPFLCFVLCSIPFSQTSHYRCEGLEFC